MKFQLEPYHRNTPDDELAADLARVAKKLNSESITIDQYNEHGNFHSTTLARRFGSWFKALERANLKKTRNLNISDDELFENLAECWLKLGRQPRYNDLSRATSAFSAGTYEYRFGSWRNALKAFVDRANDVESPNFEANAEPDIQRGTRKRRGSRNINWRLRALTLLRDGARCRLCGVTPDQAKLHVDHVMPWSRGGETILGNLQILCERCNIGKSDIVIENLHNLVVVVPDSSSKE